MKRVAFDFTEESIQDIDKLIEKYDLGSRKDLFNEAVSFFEYCLDQVAKTGRLPIVTSEEGTLIEIAAAPFIRARRAFENGQAAKKPTRKVEKPEKKPEKLAVRSAHR